MLVRQPYAAEQDGTTPSPRGLPKVRISSIRRHSTLSVALVNMADEYSQVRARRADAVEHARNGGLADNPRPARVRAAEHPCLSITPTPSLALAPVPAEHPIDARMQAVSPGSPSGRPVAR